MRSLIIGVIVVAVLALGTFVLIQGNNNKKTDGASQETDGTLGSSTSGSGETDQPAAEEVTITYTDRGFEPSFSVVKSGGKIIWVNSSSSELQIGTDPHPSHTGNKEITGNQFVLTIEPGASETVTVEEKGTFGFHNHLISDDTGSVAVK